MSFMCDPVLYLGNMYFGTPVACRSTTLMFFYLTGPDVPAAYRKHRAQSAGDGWAVS